MILLPLPSLDGVTTERLRFRKLALADKAAWRTFTSSPEAMRFLGFPPDDPAVCDQWFDRQFARYALNGAGLHAVVDRGSGALLGQCGLLVQTVDGVEELEIGYHFLPSAWRRGYATEAARACRDRAFERRLAPSIISIVHVDNVRSAGVAMRNGMTAERRTTSRDLPVNIFRVRTP